MPIDRKSLVTRHAFDQTGFDPYSPLQIGNGKIAFCADITGLQTFYSLPILSHWGWHSFPLPPHCRLEDYQWTPLIADGRTIEYQTGSNWNEYGIRMPASEQDPAKARLSQWLFQNPSRLNLGRLALNIKKSTGESVHFEDLRAMRQRLDPWTGILESEFEIEGDLVQVQAACHAERDAFAFCIRSSLLVKERLEVRLSFPYADARENADFIGDWASPGLHSTDLASTSSTGARLLRTVNDFQYQVALTWESPANFDRVDRHIFSLRSRDRDRLDFVCEFTPSARTFDTLPTSAEVKESSSTRWPAFWQSGGCIDFTGSSDDRAYELERRLVRSQYALAINSGGPLPSQESGLLSNSWHGKFHMEMYWWHHAHYALWNRWPILERSIDIYKKLLSMAQETARRQGYEGARWPKMVGPEGRESPHIINATLIWQQPHPLFLAELDYRRKGTRETLEWWNEIVTETAAFMVSYARLDPASGRHVLGPRLHIVSENTNPMTTLNPTYELSYWRTGLRIAMDWRRRQGVEVPAKWADVFRNLAELPINDGVYLQAEGLTDTYTSYNYEHPSLLGAYGMLPGDGVDVPTMHRTFEKVLQMWTWDRCWGWDFPLMAMTAARLGEPEKAVDLLLRTGSQSQLYRGNGVSTARYGEDYWLHYLPANGGLLYAVAMMAAGWDNSPAGHAPGFPANGNWKVQWEGLDRAL
jgi:hypothetical protein